MDRLGDYRLRKRIAVGGMGEVYLGEKVGPEGFVKPVVLKCVLSQLAKERGFVQLFLDEARLAALLNHPNIAQVYDFGLADGVYYIAMEYVPGYTVDDIRRKLRSVRQFMPLQHIANVASQICQGLHYAHTLADAKGEGLGLVHRDVSPHNLIVSVDGSVKLVDFGIAKAREGLTRVRAKGTVGKFGYMSPEQSRDDAVDGRSDIFSLGICLWELTTNERLHEAKLGKAPEYSPAQPVRGVDGLRPDVPRQFAQILESALAVEREDRFRNARDMHLALERFQAAMTHYAGQAALAEYIRGLVEGTTASDPGSASSESGGRAVAGEGLDAAQKYEEVFGVTMESKDRRSSMRAVPKSWEQKPSALGRIKPRPVPVVPGSPSDPHNDPEPAPAPPTEASLELDVVTPVARSRAFEPTFGTPARPAPPRSTPRSWFVVAALVLVAGLVVYSQRERLGGWAASATEMLAPEDRHGGAELTSRCRIETDPPGASVLLDGQEQEGSSPMSVELIPDVEYLIEIRMEGHASLARRVVGRVASEQQLVSVRLEPAATLRITSEPPGAKVTVDGRALAGSTPMLVDDVPGGRPFVVRAQLEDGAPAIRELSVPVGEAARIDFDLGR